METKQTTYPCGCVNVVDDKWGILKSVSKCDEHQRASGKTGMAHYVDMGAIKDGVPQHAKYSKEMLAAFDEMGIEFPYSYKSRDRALEIGCGLGMYVPLLLHRGYQYRGVEPDPVAAHWTESTFDVVVRNFTFEDYSGGEFDLIVAAHVFEHFVDAPAMLLKTFVCLAHGGNLVLIVPDDMDPVNPDHLWFFTPTTLQRILTQIGFVDIHMAVRRIVRHENFIYCIARKP